MLTWCKKRGFGRQHTTFTSCQNAACSNELFSPTGRLCFGFYFILRDHDTYFDFLRLLNCKALHFAADFRRVLGCLISSKCLLDLNNSKPISFCLWMSLFTAMFRHVGPSSLAFFLQDDLFPWIVIYRCPNLKEADCSFN